MANIGKDWTLGNLVSITMYILYIMKPSLGLNSNKGVIANFSMFKKNDTNSRHH